MTLDGWSLLGILAGAAAVWFALILVTCVGWHKLAWHDE